MNSTPRHPRSTAFLLAQIGAHAAAKFAERLDPLGLTPPVAGALRIIQTNPGIHQQALSARLGLPASRLVALVDGLEGRGLVERRDSSEDRRVHSLHLTRGGLEVFEAIRKIAREHDDAVCSALTEEERHMLSTLLGRIADEQGLTPGVHPGFSRLGRAASKEDALAVRRGKRGPKAHPQGRTDTASLVVAAQPDAVYAAFADADTLMAWLPPGGMTGRALDYDFREGGRYRIELTYDEMTAAGASKTTGSTDISSGYFLSLEPGKRIVQSVDFESMNASFAGQMIMTWAFDAVSAGTRVTITAENVPPGITQTDHDAGLRSTLENLARYLG
jgi:DNA-binding MarR family transcriptional regulator/uncharacterized protein YndB with AHSA1/START domain